ncbi:uncharacterized protein ARB_03009 [Trichophyton benhamiae CBS 112371]|uniref:U2 small nuclear ribonucleoprotein A' n=1 Tax=Arthroderma benhamiae (strain ATCC MYA-4681 / CBS 112371) TaxID=663331 RepID=D4B3H0_ARTBC|nr:uncharacterized protein ARB_03009 [Trichophyton benhamiae CBS 112371]EFE29668.1 hypothetical protein ARB_03009 [Trichophyton benhamiae CBS 112371]
MRLTVELIQNSLSYLNPLKERELDLRENFGAAKDHDAIDFTDNSISSISNFPFSPRLRSLLLARNRVSHIQPTLATSLPNLTTLVLTANNFAELADLEPLKTFPRLTHLSLLENPVTRKEVHPLSPQSWLSKIANDYQKVKDAEREKAKELFGPSTKQPTALASKILGIKSRAFDVSAALGAASSTSSPGGAGSEKPLRVKLTPEERKRVEKMIREAKSLQEITRLEKELNEGRIPRGAADADGDKDVEMT